MDDAEEEGLPEFAGEWARASAEDAEKRDAFHRVDYSEDAEEGLPEPRNGHREERGEEAGGGEEPGHADDHFANGIDGSILILFHGVVLLLSGLA